MDNSLFKCDSSYCLTQHIDITEFTDEKSYYFPNICHVCRRFGENVKIKRCSACNMISYCNKEHQKQDWVNHKQFCKVLVQMKKDWNVNSLYESLKIKSEEEESMSIFSEIRFDYRKCDMLVKCLMTKAVELLKRKLKITEFQMIQLPRICAICFETKQELLVNCKKCAQTSFCKEHINHPDHKEECHKFILNTISAPPAILEMAVATKLSTQIKTDKLPSTMVEFLKSYATKNSIDSYSEETKDILNKAFSDIYSRALSLIFALEKLDFPKNSESLVIHLAGATLAEESFNDWEIVLHFFKCLQKLTVILIGDELMFMDNKVEELCKSCRKGKKKVTVEIHRTLYDAYCGQSNFKKPDIIVCFNAGLHAYPTWEKSIRAFNERQCPLVITSFTKIECLEDYKIIRALFPSVNCVYNSCNPFESFYYFKTRIGLPVSSSNNSISIYKHLGKNIASK